MRAPNPIDPDWYIGTVTQVTASQVYVNLPNATAKPERRGLAKGAVGDFVFIDCERIKLLGRIVETKLPDAERLTVEPKLGVSQAPHPIGRIQLLAAVEQGGDSLKRGLPTFPRIGDGVYLAEPNTLAALLKNAVAKPGELVMQIGRMESANGVDVSLPPEKIFGRHCGIFGATGGGKSWTLATLIHQLKAIGGKALILDPTGEFADIGAIDEVFVFDNPTGTQKLVHFPYRHITEDDLFSLLRPSGQSQGPRLRDAIKSLKLAKAISTTGIPNALVTGSLIAKTGKIRDVYFNAIRSHALLVHSPLCDFDIAHLADQIKNECVYNAPRAGQGNLASFGPEDPAAVGYCETLMSRINTLIHSAELGCIFQSKGASLVNELNNFFNDDTKDVALISFKDVRFEHNTREILLNIIGRYLLNLARDGEFKQRPIVTFLDEAHQFLGRTVGDEYASVRLDAFGLIAKEGRKYGLTCVLATQRPRDIPQDVLSQLGTLFVHRLTNDQDRETVERACGDLDKSAAQFVPMLAPGEAIVLGPDLPAPVPLFINPPPTPPDSKGPPYQDFWRNRRTNPRPKPRVEVPAIKPTMAAKSKVKDPQNGNLFDVATTANDVMLDDEIPF